MLLQSIAADRLVIICGAGLSMAPPSQIPSAVAFARRCFDSYSDMGIEALDGSMRDDLGRLAEHFAKNSRLESFFLPKLVPWDDFVCAPNSGHIAVADLILCGALKSAVTTNYDFLVEQSARNAGSTIVSALDGDAARQAAGQAPYLKIHGCSVKDRDRTVWAPSQIVADAVIADRIAKSNVWLTSELRDKDIVFVGFWSDWAYLNVILESALSNVRPLSVRLVDPDSSLNLEAKAPALWALFSGAGKDFRHIQQSGAEFLDGLLGAFSRAYVTQAINAGRTHFEAAVAPVALLPIITTSEDTQSLRRIRCDAEGIPRSSAPRSKVPNATQQFGFCHFLMRNAGAAESDTEYELGGRRIRVLNGSDRFLHEMRSRFSSEPSSLSVSDVTICAGATDLGVPASVVRSGIAGSIVRPGVSGEWLDLPTARMRLGV